MNVDTYSGLQVGWGYDAFGNRTSQSYSGTTGVSLPQLSMEHRLDISDTQHLTLQAALADIPDAGTAAADGLGVVSAAERSRFPGSEVRAA